MRYEWPLRRIFGGFGIALVALAPAVIVAKAVDDGMLSVAQILAVQGIAAQDIDDLGGVSIDPATHTVTVAVVALHQTSPSAVLSIGRIRAIGAAPATDGPKDWPLRTSVVTYSLRQLQTVKDEVPTRQPWLSIAGPYLSIWYVDAKANVVHIGLTQATADLASAATLAFGAMATTASAPRYQRADRYNDFPPFWGGDELHSNGVGCTAGSAGSNGDPGFFTAGHCFQLGWQVFNGPTMIGVVTWAYAGGSPFDLEFIDTAIGGYWTGGRVFWAYSANTAVNGPTSLILGQTVCADGAVTLENCNGVIGQTDMCVQYEGGPYVCHLNEADSTNGRLVNHGDSGGPVYNALCCGGSYAGAVGIISGGNVANGGDGTTMFYTPVVPWLTTAPFCIFRFGSYC